MRRKAPEQTRERLLEAAATILLTRGAAQLTLDLVAEEAGVSKGGLLHHFPTKESLIVGLMKHAFALFAERLQHFMAVDASPNPGRWLRAYIRATFESAPKEDALGKALVVLAATSPALIDAKQTELDKLFAHTETEGILPARAWAIRLACDGLWVSELSGILRLDAELRLTLEAELLQLVEYKENMLCSLKTP